MAVMVPFPMGRATSKDVAARAGVSRTTVSYVLNEIENQQIPAETRARVLAAAEELGYVPNAAARQLRTGRNSLVVMAYPAWPIGGAMAAAIMAGTNRLTALGYTGLIDFLPLEGSTLDATCARTQPVALASTGILLTPELVARIRRSGTKAVIAVDNQPCEFAPTIVLGQAAATAAAVRHLAERGRQRLVALMPSEPELQWFRVEREAGARAAAEAAGVALTVLETPLTEVGIAAACTRAVGDHRADGLVAYNDDFALLALHALQAAGIGVPDDVAVVGCDDLPVGRLFTPNLTTVDPRPTEIGILVAETVHRAIQHDDLPDVIPGPEPVVIQRAST